MKSLEKKVHFKAEGTSLGCYDSDGNPVKYILVEGKPYIAIDDSEDRLLNIPCSMAHDAILSYYTNHAENSFNNVVLKGVINGKFISSNCCAYKYAERQCTKRELASFFLAMYKAYKNAIKLEAK